MMKKISILILSLSMLLMTACSKNDETTRVEIIDPVKTETTECKIREGEPKTPSHITVYVVCTDGGIAIDSAEVTLKNTTKPVNYQGNSINDYLGFDGLQADTSYEVKLKVEVSGKILTDSVTIKTKKVSIPVPATFITHNGTTYGFVTSPYTGKVWLDRNLGAARVCTSFNDTACYGDYYQWGRNFDGHEDSRSATTATQATNINTAGNDFITSSYANSHDWAKTADSDGSLRSVNWSKTDGTSVCPVGFRVPNIIELGAETLDNGVINRETAFVNFLKLATAGGRISFDGSMNDVGSWGGVWVSSAVGSYSTGLGFFATGANWGSGNRASSLSVRCLKN